MAVDREKLRQLLSLTEGEIFTCRKCRRRFYLNPDGLNVEQLEWRKNILAARVPNGGGIPMDSAPCVECHISHTAFPGETFLD